MSWIRYFLTAVRDTARSATEQSNAIFHLRDRFRKKLEKNHKALSLLDSLFINPYTTVARAAAALGVTAPTAQKTIDVLVKAKMLKENGGGWRRYWIAEPVLEVVNQPFVSPQTLR